MKRLRLRFQHSKLTYPNLIDLSLFGTVDAFVPQLDHGFLHLDLGFSLGFRTNSVFWSRHESKARPYLQLTRPGQKKMDSKYAIDSDPDHYHEPGQFPTIPL